MEEDRNINDIEQPVDDTAAENETVSENETVTEQTDNTETETQEAVTESEASDDAQPVTEDEPAGEEDAGQKPPKGDLAKKIKIGIVAAGGVFVLLAAIYAATASFSCWSPRSKLQISSKLSS